MGDSVLRFVPYERWKLETSYKVSLPAEIFSQNVIVSKNSFSFTTDSFTTSLRNVEFYINPENPLEKRVTATVSGSHPIEKEGFEKFVSMGITHPSSHKKNPVNFTISWSKDGLEAYLVSDNIPVPPQTAELKVEMSSGIKTIIGEATSSNSDSVDVEIPGMSDFVRITDISHSLIKNEDQNYDQVITVETKGSVSAEELLSHMEVYLLPNDRPEEQGWDYERNYDWRGTSIQFFTDKVKAQSLKIEPKIKAPLKTCQKGLRYFSGFTSQKIKAVKKAELKTKIVILLLTPLKYI